jgi:phosphatidylglycerophosphatase A
MKNKFFWRNVATQGAVGYGKAPGTVATIMTVPMVYFLGTLHLSVELYSLIACGFIAFGWYVASRALPFFTQTDPSQIVIDEMVAYIALFCFVPITVKTIIIGFVLFRLFDIFKPFGISYLERLPGVAGVMIDDLAAAALSNVLLQVLMWFATAVFA